MTRKRKTHSLQHWEEKSFLWCCCDRLWGIRLLWCNVGSTMRKNRGQDRMLDVCDFFHHPDILVVFPVVGGFFRVSQ